MESQRRRVCTERESGRASPERKRGREGAVPELTHALYTPRRRRERDSETRGKKEQRETESRARAHSCAPSVPCRGREREKREERKG
eukprot:1222109-Rhodomonas_salina.2